MDVRPATFRLGDDQNHYLLFINKSRADLCTPERIAYTLALGLLAPRPRPLN